MNYKINYEINDQSSKPEVDISAWCGFNYPITVLLVFVVHIPGLVLQSNHYLLFQIFLNQPCDWLSQLLKKQHLGITKVIYILWCSSSLKHKFSEFLSLSKIWRGVGIVSDLEWISGEYFSRTKVTKLVSDFEIG